MCVCVCVSVSVALTHPPHPRAQYPRAFEPPPSMLPLPSALHPSYYRSDYKEIKIPSIDFETMNKLMSYTYVFNTRALLQTISNALWWILSHVVAQPTPSPAIGGSAVCAVVRCCYRCPVLLHSLWTRKVSLRSVLARPCGLAKLDCAKQGTRTQ